MAFSNGLLTIRKSARAFARTPGLSLVLLLTIALGVGSNVSVFGFVQGLIHPNFPAKDEDHIVSIFAQDRTHPAGPLTRHQFQLLRNHPDKFVWIDGARIAPADVNLGGGSQTAIVAAVMPNLAGALSLPQNGGAILSRRMWRREFGNSVNVAGQRVRINNVDLPITGIAPDRLEGLYRDQIVDLWTTIPMGTFQIKIKNREMYGLLPACAMASRWARHNEIFVAGSEIRTASTWLLLAGPRPPWPRDFRKLARCSSSLRPPSSLLPAV